MLGRGVLWTLADIYRSIRLQGKHPVDAINDLDLNRSSWPGKSSSRKGRSTSGSGATR